MNPFVKTFVASGAINNRRYVKFTATDGVVAQASAAGDVLAGASDCPAGAVADGERIDVVVFGPADLDYGGTVAAGAFTVSDANGKAVAAAPAAGDNVVVGGRSLIGAVSGDIAKSFINPGSMTGAA